MDHERDRNGRTVLVASHVLVQQLPDGETIFLNLNTEEYFGLDAVGTSMYRALVETGSEEDAVARVLDEYDVTPERLGADLSAFVDRLVERGLLHVGER